MWERGETAWGEHLKPPAEARTTEEREKMIVYAGNKGALDLLEAVVIHEREFDGCDAVRYDGDVDAAKRNSELARFKATPSCRVLFATVDTAGVGLNIVEACNVLFLDRWFNPTRQDQAMDRCHRYGQTKPVDVRFLDSEDTIDDVMRLINEYKQGNAKTLFAGSRELPELAQKRVTWLELENVVKEKFHEIFKSRAQAMGIEHILQTVFDNLPDQDDDGAGADEGAGSTPRRWGKSDPITILKTELKVEPDDDYTFVRASRKQPIDLTVKPEPKAEPKSEPDDDDDCVLIVAAPTPAPAPSVIDLISDDDDDDAAPPAAPTRGWRCPACTVVNENPNFLSCETCGSERPP